LYNYINDIKRYEAVNSSAKIMSFQKRVGCPPYTTAAAAATTTTF